MSFDYSIIADHFAKKEADAVYSHPPKLHREPSLNEKNYVYHPQGYYLLFCIHDKHLFSPCNTCKRSEDMAAENLAKFLKSKGL